ncbi:MAG: type II secretion system F family protein [Actinomycetota bacterium]|nr:type II secretion system F family protein [Actinomycetota bacterium]
MINIYTELPDFIDFLYLLINAGLSFDESIKYLIDNMQGNIYELFKIYRLKQMEGNSKTESLRYIGKISFCLEFERILKVISEAEIVGNPINNTLRDLSKEIRRDQRDHIKIRAEKLESNLVFIIFIFIFIPMIMLFILPIIPQFKLLFK